MAGFKGCRPVPPTPRKDSKKSRGWQKRDDSGIYIDLVDSAAVVTPLPNVNYSLEGLEGALDQLVGQSCSPIRSKTGT